jgi:DNA repair protein RadC
MIPYPTHQSQPNLVFDPEAFSELERQLDELKAEFQLREVELTFKKERYFFGDVRYSSDVYEFVRDSILTGIDVQEHFIALFLSQANKIIGYYHHSTGTINSTQVDIEVLTATALKVLAKAVIIAHNHPSGSLKPSEADKKVTERVKKALAMFDIALLDHMIVTRESYYSFIDNGERSLAGPQGTAQDGLLLELREEVLRQLRRVTRASAPNLYGLLQTPDGYREAEAMVIAKAIRENMVVAAVIPHLEQEMDLM